MVPRQQKGKQLRIYLFGSPSIEYAGRPLDLRRRQVRAFLYYLASSAEAVPRECLCGLFWPDHPEAQARRNLTHLLTHLVRALPQGDWFATAGDTVSLAPAQVWVDARAFAQGLALPSSPRGEFEPEPLAPQDRARLEEAVRLYRGEFLSGFSLPASAEFDTWACREREHGRHQYLRALARLVRDRAASGDTARAIEYAQRYLAADDLAEEMHRRLIELYAAKGDRAAALRQYEVCVAALERELGVNPLPETLATYQAVLRGVDPSPIPISAPVPQIPSLHTLLVGRADALALLRRAWEDASAAHGRMVFVSGEAGIGKTRLVSEFATSALARGSEESQGKETRILAGGAQAGEAKTPYFPLLSALRGSLNAADWRALSPQLDDVWLAECARVLPEIRVHRRDLPRLPAGESRFSRAQLFEALTRLFLAFDERLLVFLDDMQWADSTTMAWLGTLPRRIANERILLVLAYRDDALTADLSRLREAVGRMDLSVSVPLKRLSLPQVTELVRQLSRQTEGAVLFSQRLHGETDGNPFFLLETLRTLLGQAVVRPAADGWTTDWDEATRDYRELPLPESVRSLLASRLLALPPTARQIADVAAVAGPTFDDVLVQRASGRSEEEVADALDHLVAHHIVHETHLAISLPSAVERYAFTHDKLQEEAYHELSSARRRLLHRRVGEALATLDPNAVTALARHFEQARDWTRAAVYTLRAGQGARRVFAHNEARLHLDHALLLLQLADKTSGSRKDRAATKRMRLEALDGRGWVLRLLGEMDAYVRDLEEVVSLAKELGDRRSQARACWRQAYAALWFCRYDQVLQAASEGITQSRAVGDMETEIECVWTMALAARATGEYARARAGLERAWSFFSTRENPVAQVHLLSHLSTLNLSEKRYGAAERTARQALGLCDQEQLAYHRRLPLGDLGAVAVERGDAAQADTYLLASLSIARQVSDRTQEIFCLGYLGWLSVRLKSAAKAREYFTDALRIAQAVGSRAEQSWLYTGLAEAHSLAGDFAQARDAAQCALALAEQFGQKRDRRVAAKLLSRV